MILDRLVLRVKGGLHSTKYKQVDYDKLRALAAEKKFAAQESVLKVRKLEQVMHLYNIGNNCQ